MSQGQKQLNPKSSLLWNVVDPDDPYDIRKSMIARLPDHTENFMGANLQIVCLMQAAQIERLNTYLSQFKLRYRELERKQLDRHSYQIQIKQLSQKSNEASKLRIDNQKLRDYIRKQTIQLEELTRRPSVSQSFQTEHEELFKKYQSLLVQLQNSREIINSQTLTLSKSIEQNKQLRIKYDRLDKQRLTQITQEREKYELKIRERIEMEIKEVQHKYSSKIYQLESDCRLYKQQLESKNHEIASLMSRNQSLKRELENKQKQTQVNIQYEDKVKELQSINLTLSKKAEEFQRTYEQYIRIQGQLRDIQKAFHQCQQKNRFYRGQIDRLNQARKDDEARDARMIQLQNKSALLSQQIQRLSYMLENKNKDSQQFDFKINSTRIEYENKIKQLTYQYEQKISTSKQSQERIDAMEAELRPLRTLTMELKLKNQMLMKEISSLSTSSQRCQELENEIRKANTIITDKNNHILSLEAKLKLGEASSYQMTTIKNSYMQTTRMLRNVEMILSTYTGRPSEGASNEEIIKIILRELDKKKQMREELEREVHTTHQLRNALKQTQKILGENNDLISRLRKEINDMKSMNQQYENDIKKGNLVAFNVMEVEIRRNVEEARKKLQTQFEKDFRKSLEDKTNLERANSDLSHEKRILQQQITVLRDKLERKNLEVDQSYANIETRYMNQVHDLSNSLKAVREQNQRLTNQRNKLKNTLAEFERQIGSKQRQQNQIIKDISKKSEELRISNEELKRENARLKEAINETQDTAFRSQRQIEQRFIKIYTSQLQDKDNIISSLERQVKTCREEMKSLQAASQSSSSSLKNYRDRLLMVSQEIQRLNEILTNKNKEIDGLKAQLGSIESTYRKQSADKDEQIRRIKIKVEEVDVTIRRETHVKQEEIRGLRSHIDYMNGEMQKRVAQKQSIEQQFRNLKSRFDNMEIVLKKQITQRQTQIKVMAGQLEGNSQNIRHQLTQKDREINALKSQLNRLNSAYYAVHQQQLDWQRKEKQLREQLQALQQYIVNLQENIRIYAEKQKTMINQQGDYQELLRNFQYSQQQNISKNQELNLLHNQLEFKQRKMTEQQIEIKNLKQILKQMQEINIQLTRERDNLINIQNKLEQRLLIVTRQVESKERVLIELRTKFNQVNVICSQHQQRIKRYEEALERQGSAINQNEQVGRRRQQQINRLNNLLAQIEQDKIQLLRQINEGGTLKIQLQQSYEKIQKLLQVVDAGKRTIQSREEEISRLTTTLHSLQARTRAISQLQAKCQQSDIQIRNLKQMLQQMEEINFHTVAQRDQLFQLSHEYKEEINNLRLALQNKEKNVSQAAFLELTNSYRSLEAEFLVLKDKIKKYQVTNEALARKNQQYEGKLRELIGENDRLRLIIIERQKNVGNVNELHQRISELELELINSKEEAKEWQQKYIPLYNAYKTESEVSKNKILEYQRKITALDQQFEQFNILIRTTRQQNEELKKTIRTYEQLIEKNRQLGIQIDRLNAIIANLKQDLSDTRLRLTDQMALQKRVQQYMSLMVILFAEIETLRNRVSQTQQQCENVRRSSLTPHRVDRQVGRSVDSKVVR